MTPVVPRPRVIPFACWVTACIVFLVFCLLLGLVLTQVDDVPVAVKFIIAIVAPLLLAGYTLVIGYVYGDARRRGMRYMMWTLLAIFLFNGIGVILYFILRDPLLVYCHLCGAGVLPSHAFCPRCGNAVQPTCQSCHRTVQSGWTHCAWCGNQL